MPRNETDCAFCEIAARATADTYEVYGDKDVVAFFPLEPATLGHTLVIPRGHVPDIWSLDEATAAYLARVTVRLAPAMRTALQMEGLNVIQSNGDAASQTVFHLHIHLVPRWPDDAVGRIWPVESIPIDHTMDAAWERLRAVCREVMGQ
jgi:histidine triad (HIT) family protein